MPVSLPIAAVAVVSVCLVASGIVRGRRWRFAAGIVGVLGSMLLILQLGASISGM